MAGGKRPLQRQGSSSRRGGSAGPGAGGDSSGSDGDEDPEAVMAVKVGFRGRSPDQTEDSVCTCTLMRTICAHLRMCAACATQAWLTSNACFLQREAVELNTWKQAVPQALLDIHKQVRPHVYMLQ